MEQRKKKRKKNKQERKTEKSLQRIKKMRDENIYIFDDSDEDDERTFGDLSSDNKDAKSNPSSERAERVKDSVFVVGGRYSDESDGEMRREKVDPFRLSKGRKSKNQSKIKMSPASSLFFKPKTENKKIDIKKTKEQTRLAPMDLSILERIDGEESEAEEFAAGVGSLLDQIQSATPSDKNESHHRLDLKTIETNLDLERESFDKFQCLSKERESLGNPLEKDTPLEEKNLTPTKKIETESKSSKSKKFKETDGNYKNGGKMEIKKMKMPEVSSLKANQSKSFEFFEFKREETLESENEVPNENQSSEGEENPNYLDLFSNSNGIQVESEGTEKINKLSSEFNNNLKSILIYWFDAFENPISEKGTLFLFGKNLDGKSCCIAVRNLKKTIYFYEINESKSVKNSQENNESNESKAQSKIRDGPLFLDRIRKRAEKLNLRGAKFKTVKRKNCFDGFNAHNDSLEKTYVKCEILARDAHLLKKLEKEKGFKILGANTSCLEEFIIGKRLMGPCWLAVSDFSVSESKFSWCKYDYVVDSPSKIYLFVPNKDIISNSKNKKPNEKSHKITTQKIGQKFNATKMETLTKTQPKLSVLSLYIGTAATKSGPEIVLICAVVAKDAGVESSSPRDFGTNAVDTFACVRAFKNSPFPAEFQKRIGSQKRPIRTCSSERELLSYFLAKVHSIDPDILVGHNLHKFHLNALLGRMKKLKVPNWSRLCRLKRKIMPFPRPMERGLCCGRLYVDTLVGATEFSEENEFSLAHLARKFFGAHSVDVSPTEMELKFASADSLLQTVGHGCNNAFLSLRLMRHLLLLPLTLQLTNLCGNLWSRSLQSKRAERNEFMLLHELRAKKFIPPEPKPTLSLNSKSCFSNRKGNQYTGGLVLEPAKSLYDKIVVLLDFASLYPSIIKEYNICFTSIYKFESVKNEESEIPSISENEDLILPQVIDRLMRRRMSVKRMLKNSKNPKERASLEIRQKAFKLVANSIYGCLGFERSRFCCKKMASLITLLGRKNLLAAKEIAEKTPLPTAVKVVYGDTDSIMVATDETDLRRARKISKEILKVVNKQYRCMRMECDGLFRTLLLLQKKKYAANLILGEKNGRLAQKLVTKGIDLVRREFCPLSKEIGRKILLEILSSAKSREEVVEAVTLVLDDVKKRLLEGKEPPSKFIITKTLSKDPSLYADAKIHPHVQVALALRREGRKISAGDQVQYIIAEEAKESNKEGVKNSESSPALRAVHISKFFRSKNKQDKNSLKVDTKWYLLHQFFPPIARLCAPIPELPASSIAHSLGISKCKGLGNQIGAFDSNAEEAGALFSIDSSRGNAPRNIMAMMRSVSIVAREDRFPLSCRFGCPNGLWEDVFDSEGRFSLVCGNKDCKSESLVSEEADLERLQRKLEEQIEKYVGLEAKKQTVCDALMCGKRGQGTEEKKCDAKNCSGTLVLLYPATKLLKQLRYFATIFDAEAAQERARLRGNTPQKLPSRTVRLLRSLKTKAKDALMKNESYFVDLKTAFNDFLV